MKFKKTIKISKKEADWIEKALHSKDLMGEDDIVTKTAEFDNGITIDIKLCGSQDDYPWTEAVVFENGAEAGCTDVCEDFLGVWEIEHGKYTFIVNVEVEEN